MQRVIGLSKYTYIHNANILEYITATLSGDDLTFINKPVSPARGPGESFTAGSMGSTGKSEILNSGTGLVQS